MIGIQSSVYQCISISVVHIGGEIYHGRVNLDIWKLYLPPTVSLTLFHWARIWMEIIESHWLIRFLATILCAMAFNTQCMYLPYTTPSKTIYDFISYQFSVSKISNEMNQIHATWARFFCVLHSKNIIYCRWVEFLFAESSICFLLVAWFGFHRIKAPHNYI